MITDAAFFAVLSLAAGIAGVACGHLRGATFAFQAPPGVAAPEPISGALRPLTSLFLGLSFLFALLAGAGLWIERGVSEGSVLRSHPPAWGALWVCALLHLIECRTSGLAGTGRRLRVGVVAAVMGVLALGFGFELWLKLAPLPVPACEGGSPVLEGAGLGAMAALGLSLALIAGPALRLLPLGDLPLSATAASVAVAAWMQPTLPALGWLPVSAGGGAPLALLLSAALWLLLRSNGRGGRVATAAGISAWFLLVVGGSAAIGVL